MTLKQFERLKIGDLVTQVKGNYRGEPAKVDFIWDLTDSNGYREILIFASYLNPKIHKCEQRDFNCNYRFLKIVEES